MLYIPGNRESWIETAHEHDADVIILDLEDSVPPDEKDLARSLVSEHVPRLQTEEDQRVYVRINGHPNDSDGMEADVEAVVCDELEGIKVPKPRYPDDIAKLDTILTHIERRDGLPEGSTEVLVSIETAEGMYNVHDLCTAADRVATMTAGATKGTDTNKALGFEWTGPGKKGLETLHMREKALLDARAAGISYPLAGTYVDVDDIEGLREDMTFSREMGYTGYVVIHPSHVEHANEIFTPDAETVQYWLNVREALVEAEKEGKSAVRYEGDMIDIANIGMANEYLAMAKEFEDDLGIDIDTE